MLSIDRTGIMITVSYHFFSYRYGLTPSRTPIDCWKIPHDLFRFFGGLDVLKNKLLNQFSVHGIPLSDCCDIVSPAHAFAVE
jgi:hypothetical protein